MVTAKCRFGIELSHHCLDCQGILTREISALRDEIQRLKQQVEQWPTYMRPRGLALEDAIRSLLRYHRLELVSMRAPTRFSINVLIHEPHGPYCTLEARVPGKAGPPELLQQDVDDALYAEFGKQLDLYLAKPG